MADTYLIIGIILLIVGAYAFYDGVLILGIPLILIALFLLIQYYRSSTKHVNKKVSNITYDGIIETGESKIERGTFYIDRDKFLTVMEKIKDLIATQGHMPEFGLDAIYLNYRNQSRAEVVMNAINERGVKASLLQERSDWKVKIDFD